MTEPELTSLEEALLSPRFIRAVGLLFFGTIVVLAVGHFLVFFVMQEPPLSIKFQLNLEQEGNLTTWISSLMLLSAAAAAFLVAWLVKRNGSTMRKAEYLGWLCAGGTFFYLATDEAAQIHELLQSVLANNIRQFLPWVSEKLSWYMWIPLFFVLGSLTVVLLFSLLRRAFLQDRVATLFVAAGVLLYALNPIPEILEKMRTDLLPPELWSKGQGALRTFNPRAWYELQGLIIIEECMEMAGATCFLLGFLNHGRHVLSGGSRDRPTDNQQPQAEARPNDR